MTYDILVLTTVKNRVEISTQNKKFACLCNISRKTCAVKFRFCLQTNTKVFYKLIVSLWVCRASHAQNTQNNKFAISLQYLKENMKDKVEFLPADKHRKFLQIIFIILGVYGQAYQNYLK